jgi:hypothetical protein
LLLAGILAVATSLGLLLLIGGVSGARNALHYAFVDIPEDQFWYFGTPPLPYVERWTDVFADQRVMLALGVAAVQMLLLARWSRTSPTGGRLAPPFIGAIVYGVAASVGYLSYKGYQFHLPLIRIELTIALVLVWRLLNRLREAEPARFSGPIRLLQFGFFFAVLLAGPLQSYGPSSILLLPRMLRTTADGVEKLANGEGRLSDATAEHVQQALEAMEKNRSRSGRPTIWSEYAGLLEARLGVFHPSHDYIIHARGRTSSTEYLEAFRTADAEFAFTFHATSFPHVEKLQSCDWEFYEELYLNYDLLVRTRRGCLWGRRPGPWRRPANEGWIDLKLETPKALILPAAVESPTDSLVRVVELRYEISPSAVAFLPVVGKSARHLLEFFDTRTKTPLAVRPYSDRVVFPVALKPGVPAHCHAISRSLVGGHWTLTAARMRVLPPDESKKYLLTLK